MVQSSRKVVFLDTSLPCNRHRALKPLHLIQELDEGSTDIFLDEVVEKYMNCFSDIIFESMLMGEYFSNYEIGSHTKKEEGERVWKD